MKALSEMTRDELDSERASAYETYKITREALREVRNVHGATKIKREAVAAHDASLARRSDVSAEFVRRFESKTY